METVSVIKKRQAENENNENSKEKRPKIDLFTSDPVLAQRLQFTTEVIANDGKIIYTSWALFDGFEYADSLLRIDKPNQEAKRQIKLMYLNIDQSLLYLKILSLFKNSHVSAEILEDEFNSMQMKMLFNIYSQLDYHLLFDLKKICQDRIKKLNYSIELYLYNLETKILSNDEIAQKLRSQIYAPISYPPQTDVDFWTVFMNKINGCDIEVAWRCLRNFEPNFLEQYQQLYSVKKLDTNSIMKLILVYKQDQHLIRFLYYISTQYNKTQSLFSFETTSAASIPRLPAFIFGDNAAPIAPTVPFVFGGPPAPIGHPAFIFGGPAAPITHPVFVFGGPAAPIVPPAPGPAFGAST